MAISNITAAVSANASSAVSSLLAQLGITSASNSHQSQETGAKTSERNQLTTAQQQHVQDMLTAGEGLFPAASPAGDKQTTRLQQREESARARHARHAKADEGRYEKAKAECDKKTGMKCAKKMLRAAEREGATGKAKEYLKENKATLLKAVDKQIQEGEKLKAQLNQMQRVVTQSPIPQPRPTTTNSILRFEPTPVPKAESELTVKPIKTKKPALTPGPDEDIELDEIERKYKKLNECVRAGFGSNKDGENTCRLTNHCKIPVKIETETDDTKKVTRLKIGSSAPCFKTGETTTKDRQGNMRIKNLFENIRSSKVKVSKDDDG